MKYIENPKPKQFKRKMEGLLWVFLFLLFLFVFECVFYVLVVFEQKDYIGWLVKM